MLRTPKAHFSPHKRTQIVTEYLLGMPAKVVAIKYGTSPRGVYGVVQRSRIQKPCISRPKTGRPPALSQTDKYVLRRLVTQDPFATAGQLKLQGEIGCSSQTISKRLRLKWVLDKEDLRRKLRHFGGVIHDRDTSKSQAITDTDRHQNTANKTLLPCQFCFTTIS
jgi:hypothetical protein